jgi:hypothetical protein
VCVPVLTGNVVKPFCQCLLAAAECIGRAAVAAAAAACNCGCLVYYPAPNLDQQLEQALGESFPLQGLSGRMRSRQGGRILWAFTCWLIGMLVCSLC